MKMIMEMMLKKDEKVQEIKVPVDSKILSVQSKFGFPFLCVLMKTSPNQSVEMKTIKIQIIETFENIPDDFNGTSIGSYSREAHLPLSHVFLIE